MMGNNKLSFFEIRIGWGSPGKYPPPSEWLLSYDRTMKRWGPAHVSHIITVIGFYILITLRRDTKKGSDDHKTGSGDNGKGSKST